MQLVTRPTCFVPQAKKTIARLFIEVKTRQRGYCSAALIVASVRVANSPPLVIGATGGSGTRVVARITELAGYNLGTNVNSAGDALEFYDFHEKWINPYVSAEIRGQPMTPWQMARMKEDFHAALARHMPAAERRGTRWGWKAPRTVYLLPFLQSQFEKFKFIHVLRDPRDMALSRNQNQPRKHASAMLSFSERLFRSAPECSAILWARANERAADYGQSKLGENYLPVRFEDLCQKPLETTVKILNFLQATIDPEPIARSEITPPPSLGRWRAAPSKSILRIEKVAESSLRRFGYSV